MDEWQALDQKLSEQYLSNNKQTPQEAQGGDPIVNQFNALNQQLAQQYNVKDVVTSTPSTPTVDDSFLSGMAQTFVDGVENFNRSFGKVVEGTLDLGAQISSIVGGGEQMSQYSRDVQQYSKQMDASAAQAAERSPIASTIGTVLGIGAQAALPIGQVAAGAPRLASAMTGAGTGMALGFVGTPGDVSQRLESAATGSLLGGALGAAAPEINRAIKGVGGYLSNKLDDSGAIAPSGLLRKTLNPTGAAMKDIAAEAQAAGGIDNIQGRKMPFKGIGIEPTAEQAVGSGPLSGILKGINNTPERARMLEGGFIKQQKDLLKKSKDLLDSFVPEGPEVAKAQNLSNYESLKNINIPDDTVSAIKTNKSIDSRLKQFNMSEDNLVKDLPDNNLYKLNEFKKSIDSELFNNVHGMKDGAKPLLATEKEALTQASTQLRDQLDKAYPEYANIRKLGERNIMYNKFTELLNEKKPVAGTLLKEGGGVENKSLAQVYDTLWGTEAKQEYFLDSLKSVGGDVKNAEDLIKVLNMTQKNALEKVYNTSYADYPTTIGGDKLSLIQRTVYNLSKRRYQDAMIKLMFSGDEWQSKLAKALDHKSIGSKIKNVVNLIGDVAKRGANAAGMQGYDSPTFSPGAVGAAIGSSGMLGSDTQKQGLIK